MKINDTPITNFKGIYRLPYTTENLQAIKKLEPVYRAMRKEPYKYFVGTNPLKYKLLAAIESLSKEKNKSHKQIQMDALKNGLDITDIGDNVMYVLTGKKDAAKLYCYLSCRYRERAAAIYQTMLLSEGSKIKKQMPEYIKSLVDDIISDKYEDMAFHEYCNKPIDVENPWELAEKIADEK